ncbi:hypothetical protein TSTA_001120 [Talaromyces stipitatus ATCC 10500]|uniref:Uncharacterized protein n=1 Tax=Talaromyces stipitatus (strain ATCC 10500 / CBS 375.48 / QM 6759 / NRRL 1006) TaxID=441959 RepID=B8MT16_TALSN|nr:uncharacterized protein TSTA_001120 [Talaromyces stipitatus ATCC 10500]EED12040.1 hypothetical protein TSTA_001120 [Talaromyces stipitatus ATCC 10500]
MNLEHAALIAEASRMHNESRAKRRYNVKTKEYSQAMHRYEIQRKDIKQTFTWIRDSVSVIYLKSHVSVTHDWVKAYNNLKTALNPGSREIKRSIRKGKSMTFALDKEDWSTRFIEAIRPLDPVWVITLEHDVEEKLDDDTLTYGDMSRYFQRKQMYRLTNEEDHDLVPQTIPGREIITLWRIPTPGNTALNERKEPLLVDEIDLSPRNNLSGRTLENQLKDEEHLPLIQRKCKAMYFVKMEKELAALSINDYPLKHSALLDSGSSIYVFNEKECFINFKRATPGDFL